MKEMTAGFDGWFLFVCFWLVGLRFWHWVYVAQVGLEFTLLPKLALNTDPLTSIILVLGLQACANMPALKRVR